jgi:hypothetical protein
MNDVTALLRRALDDEPPAAFVADDLVGRGRRTRRRRRAAAGGCAVALVAVASAGVVGLAGGDPATTPVPVAAGSTTSEVPERLTAENAERTIEDRLGIVFRDVNVHERMPAPDGAPALTVSGAIADPGGDSAFGFHLTGPDDGVTKRWQPTCEGSDFGNPGDRPAEEAYVGTCSTRTLANGAIVLWRSGRAPGGYARSSAMLGRPDGSWLAVEATNQAAVDPATCVESAAGKACPTGAVTRTEPAVTAEALRDLLVALEPATR